jgi:tRNA1Val (adenine37-N6)-methyltransferase
VQGTKDIFHFKQFSICQDTCALKVGTDGVLLGSWAQGGKRILDIGTGTGLIALMMAQRFPDAVVDAVEIDADAAAQAMENVKASPFADRIYIHETAIQKFTPFPPQGTFDSIVSNPPFFQQSLKAPDAKRTLARHTDSLSFRDLIKSAVRLLAATGEFSVVIPFNMRTSLIDEAIIQGLSLSRSVAVKTVPHKAAKRYLLAFRKEHSENIVEQEVVMTESGERSPWYQELTKDFYL